jgi:hypothetical protein
MEVPSKGKRNILPMSRSITMIRVLLKEPRLTPPIWNGSKLDASELSHRCIVCRVWMANPLESSLERWMTDSEI